MTKKKIAWVTDSTATLSKDYIDKYNIHVVPMEIIFGDQSYREDIDITAEDFYKKLSESKVLPKTSQPALGSFVNLYEQLKEEYEYAIAIHASSALTGTYQSSVSASQMAEFHSVEVIDSKIGSYPLGKMIQQGVEMEEQGKSYEEIVAYLRTLPDKAQLLMAPGSLEQLHKGGRLSSAQAIIGNLIQLKLIIKFDNGKVIMHDRIRTEKKVKLRLFEMFAEVAPQLKEASVIHANEAEKALQWKAELEQLYPHISFTTTMFSPVPGVHTGQGTMGLSWITE
ncbi:DegV family protein [Ectobacillus ponti]|uniref:DegV family protein n=1 Tax=Ectobacillus ponti TaxID=2961894 RepID=A0AA41XD24_9BACI|nr:DegV family protein [Ectobacillus ponti]MCP8970643.1 DegV family protein [Ectobacillus ponti]